MASLEEELNVALELVGYREPQHGIIVAANNFMSLENYLAIVIGEINELAAEYEQWKQRNEREHKKTELPKTWFMELYDVIVTLRNAREKTAPNFSIENTHFSVNGQYNGGLDSLTQQVLNLGSGNIERNFQSIFAILLSMVKHLDISLQADIYVNLVNRKLENNKESRFYQKEPGMREEDFLVKYDHVTQSLRNIRNFLRKTTGQEITLQPWITDFFVEEILDWRNSGLALVRLQQKLILFQQKIKDEMVWNTTANLSDPNFEMKMLIAGAKVIGAAKRA